MPPSREVWAAAFAAQSQSDWQVYNLLAGEPWLPPCHELHYLQMSCEKIAKAYRCRDTAADLEELLKRHIGFAKFIGSFLSSPMIKEAYRGRSAQLQKISKLSRALAREIEKLAPAVDRAGSPENAEYPWESGDDVVSPCQYSYPRLSLLTSAGGRTLLKLVARAIQDFERTAT
ncbi:MAG TPA: hypothetical protein VF756_19185 [Thermoanaerobaculia bacterium]